MVIIFFSSSFHLHLDLERKRKSNLLPEIPIKRNRNPSEKVEYHHPNESGQDPKDKWKRMKLPDLINFNTSDGRGSEGTSSISNANAREKGIPETPSSSSSPVKFSTADIGSMLSCSLEVFLKNNPLMSHITRKRKMSEDIDLK